MRSDDETALQCLEVGALSYLTKAEAPITWCARRRSASRTSHPRSPANWPATGRQAPTKAALVARVIRDGLVGLDDL